MRLIDKEQAQKMLLDLVSRIQFRGAYFAGIRDAYQSAADRLDTLPVVAERKHGRWKDGCCTVCGESAALDVYGGSIDEESQKYCWNCGAIMDGDSK